jgi:hypothetical protein
MKVFVITVMFVSLYLLYRIAYPKPPGTKQGDNSPQNGKTDPDEGVGRSNYVPTFRRQPQQTSATEAVFEKPVEKPNIFAPANETAKVVIPSAELDEVFTGVMDIDYPLERETETPDADEEAEELRGTFGRDTELADGFTYEEMAQAIDTSNSPDEAGATLYRLEKTDLFEQLVSGDAGRSAGIKAVIDRHIQSIMPEETAENEDDNNEYGNFNIADFLS